MFVHIKRLFIASTDSGLSRSTSVSSSTTCSEASPEATQLLHDYRPLSGYSDDFPNCTAFNNPVVAKAMVSIFYHHVS